MPDRVARIRKRPERLRVLGQPFPIPHALHHPRCVLCQDGRRRVLAISEVLGVQDERIVTNELFVYQLERKAFEATGLSPASPKLRLHDDDQATKFHRSW